MRHSFTSEADGKKEREVMPNGSANLQCDSGFGLRRQVNVYPWNCIKVKILTEALVLASPAKPNNRHKVYQANTPLKAHDYRWRNLTQRLHIIYMTTHSTHTQNSSTIYKKLELFSFIRRLVFFPCLLSKSKPISQSNIWSCTFWVQKFVLNHPRQMLT